MFQNRRDLFKYAGAGILVSSAAALLPQGDANAKETGKHTSALPDIGRKFYSDGRVRPFSGNTIICHVPQQGEDSGYFNALLDVYREVPAHSFMRKVTLLPPSSYHMTIFGCANDQDRKPRLWPEGVPMDAPMETCNRILAEKLRAFRLEMPLPIRMKVDLSAPDEKPFVVRLLPADDTQNRQLRTLISRLSEYLGIFPPNIEQYRFHTTMGYQFQVLSAEEMSKFHSQMRKWRADIARKSPEIILGAPEFCLLDDMFAFHRQFYLQ
jgi:hypothetical protein